MSSPNTILFDLDGTLADTAGDLNLSLNLLLEQEQRPPMPLETMRPCVGQGAAHLIQAAYHGQLADGELERLTQDFLVIYAKHLLDTTCLFPGVVQTIAILAKRRLRWGIVTNKSEHFAVPIIKKLGLYEDAACLVCGDTTKAKKPSPIPLLHAANQLNIEPADCIYVGDHLNDVKAANSAGMYSLIVAYGYHATGSDLSQWNSDAILNNIGDLIEWLDSRY